MPAFEGAGEPASHHLLPSDELQDPAEVEAAQARIKWRQWAATVAWLVAGLLFVLVILVLVVRHPWAASGEPAEERAHAQRPAAAQAGQPEAVAAHVGPAAASSLRHREAGLPTECGASGDNCLRSRCCHGAGMQCYQENAHFATCRSACDAAGEFPQDTKGWQCTELGNRTADNSTRAGSWPGDDCSATRRCNRAGYVCFAKNDYFASCKPAGSCNSTEKDPYDGERWSCKELGGWKDLPAIEAVPKEEALGTSLFCFLVVTPTNGEEQALMEHQRDAKRGVFACDASGVFNAVSVGRGHWKSVINTDIFVGVWRKVQADGRYRKHDWAVKVDADAVFFPGRLKWHLEKLSPPKGAQLYLKNCDFKFRFQGSLEVFSRPALDAYLEGQGLCAEGNNIGHDGGEDRYMQMCMDALGIGFMTDTSVLNDKYTWLTDYDMGDPSFCHNGWTAAFHPLKQVGLWQACFDQAMAAQADAQAKDDE